MYKLKYKVFVLLSVLVLALANLPKVALADTIPLKANNFQVTIQPEYDDPRTLVIYQGDMYATGTDVVKKGTPISFIIPQGASKQKLNINMACEINSQGGHDCQPYTTKDIGNGQLELSWKLSKDVAPNQKYPVYLEFYYDNGTNAPNKSFTYKFKPTFDIDNLGFVVTQPKNASNFTVDPAAASTSQDNGLTNYVISVDNKTPKDTVLVKISYNKADNTPSFAKPQVGSQTQAQNQTGQPSLGSSFTKPEVLIPILLFVVAIVFLFIYASKNPQKPVKQNGTFQPVRKNNNARPASVGDINKLNSEKSKLRKALLDGKINEDTYKEMMADLLGEQN